MLKTT